MTDLTKSERHLLVTLNVLRTISIIVMIVGCILALFFAGMYDTDDISFNSAIIRVIICGIVTIFGLYIYQYITDVHDDMCYDLGLLDEISHIKMDNMFYGDKYEGDIKRLYAIRYANHNRKRKKPVNNKMNHYFTDQFDLRKMYPNVDVIPKTPGPELKFTPMMHRNAETNSIATKSE